MELAANALTTLEAVKGFLGIADNSADDRLITLINAVSAMIESYCDRHLGKVDYDEVYPGSDRQKLLLNQYPIVNVTSVTAGDSLITDYRILADEGALYRVDCWPSEIAVWGLTDDPAEKRLTYEVEYTAGYVLPKDGTPENPRTLPYDLEHVCIVWVQQVYQYGDRLGVDMERIGDYQAQYSKQGIPPGIADALNRYVRRWC